MTEDVKDNDNLDTTGGLTEGEDLTAKPQEDKQPGNATVSVRDSKAKPDGLPEDFWDSEKKALKTDILVEEYKKKDKIATDLRRILSTKGSGLPPEKIEEYKVEAVNKDLASYTSDTNPAIGSARKAAMAAGLSTEQFNKFINGYLGDLKDNGLLQAPEPEKTPEQQAQESKEYRESEMKKLGVAGKAHFEEFNDTIRVGLESGAFTEKDRDVYKDIMRSADHVRFMKKFITVYGGRPSTGLGVPTDAVISEGMLTRQELALMGQDPRIKTDMTFRKKWEDGYKRLEAAGKL